MEETKESKAPPTILLMLLACLASFTSVLFTPALPAVTKAFNISEGVASKTMSYFLFGYTLGLLIYAPISNRFGRRVALFVGLIISIIASILCIISGHLLNFEFFIWSRFFQAFGATTGLQVAVTLIGDCYKPPKSTKVMSFVTLAFAIGPSLGVALGGVLTEYIGWTSCFYFLVLYLAFLFVFTWKKVKETLVEKEYDAIKIKNIFCNYIINLKKLKITLAGILVGLTSSFSYVFSTLAPFLGIDTLKLSASIYGYYYMIPPIGLVVGSFVANILAKHCRAFLTTGIGVGCMIFSTLVWFVFFLFKQLNVFSLFFPMITAFFGLSLILTNMMSVSMHHAEDKSLGAATVNFLNLLVATLSVYCLPKDAGGLLVMPTVFIIVSILMILVFIWAGRIYKRLGSSEN